MVFLSLLCGMISRVHFCGRMVLRRISVSGLVTPHKGQVEGDPGTIIIGYDGDPGLGQRPSWTKDGSILVFAKLEQDVLEYNKYLKDKGQNFLDTLNLSEEDRRKVQDPAGLFG